MHGNHVLIVRAAFVKRLSEINQILKILLLDERGVSHERAFHMKVNMHRRRFMGATVAASIPVGIDRLMAQEPPEPGRRTYGKRTDMRSEPVSRIVVMGESNAYGAEEIEPPLDGIQHPNETHVTSWSQVDELCCTLTSVGTGIPAHKQVSLEERDSVVCCESPEGCAYPDGIALSEKIVAVALTQLQIIPAMLGE